MSDTGRGGDPPDSGSGLQPGLGSALRTPPNRSRFGARAQLFASGIFFGLMAVLTRMACHGPGAFTSGQAATVRFGGGALACLALFAARPGTFAPVQKRLLVTRGLLGGAAALLYFVALARIPAGEATLLNATHPVFATLFAVFALGERPTVRLALALLLTSAGVGCVLGGGTGGLALGWGEAAGMASALLGAGAIVSIRALRPTDNAATIFFAFCLGGFAVSLPVSLDPWPMEPRAWALVAAVVALSVAAQLLMTHAFGFLTVPEASVWQQVAPVASYLWALGLLGESVSALGAVGVALVLLGVAWGAVPGRVRASKASSATAPS
ncbi:MAG: DMT family transporter [Myxococcales bacterium]